MGGLSSTSIKRFLFCKMHVSLHQRRWQLSCHFLSCKLTFNVLLKQFEANISPVVKVKKIFDIVAAGLSVNTIEKNITFKIERLHKNKCKFICHQIRRKVSFLQICTHNILY